MANTAELVFIPAPGLGHIMSTIEVAKLFVNRDQRFSITVLVIKPPSSTSGSAITAYFESLAKTAINRVSFVELPQDDAPPVHDLKSFLTSLDEYIKSHCKYVRNVVAELLSQPGSAGSLGLCAAFLGYELFMQTLNDDEKQDVVELSNADTEVSVPSFVKPVPTKFFWDVLRTKDGLEVAMSGARKLREITKIARSTPFFQK
ncbi:putative flavonol 3-O-glucosyltransferase [Helianthus anomalus]